MRLSWEKTNRTEPDKKEWINGNQCTRAELCGLSPPSASTGYYPPYYLMQEARNPNKESKRLLFLDWTVFVCMCVMNDDKRWYTARLVVKEEETMYCSRFPVCKEQGYKMQSSRSWTRKTEENEEMESLLSLLLQANVQFKWWRRTSADPQIASQARKDLNILSASLDEHKRRWATMQQPSSVPRYVWSWIIHLPCILPGRNGKGSQLCRTTAAQLCCHSVPIYWTGTDNEEQANPG